MFSSPLMSPVKQLQNSHDKRSVNVTLKIFVPNSKILTKASHASDTGDLIN